MQNQENKTVEQFKQLLFWPVQLLPCPENPELEYWDRMKACKNTAWKAVPDEFAQEGEMLRETSYQQFISYLPFAQRFLYGEGLIKDCGNVEQDSPVHIFYRHDLRKVRVQMTKSTAPIELNIGQCTLFFFHDVDIAMVCLEINGKNLPLSTVMDLQYYFGRTYPSHWEENEYGYMGDCLHSVAWLDKEGKVLNESNYHDSTTFLEYAKRTRTVKDASHWSFLIEPMVQHYHEGPSTFRYRKIGYRRTPMISYIAVDDPRKLTRGDIVRLGLFTACGDAETLPYSSDFLADFEKNHCYDRYWDSESDDIRLTTRIMSCEQGVVLLGSTQNKTFIDGKMGTLLDFNTKYFMLFLISHFQNATIMMVTDKLVHAICNLDITNKCSYKEFADTIKLLKESFLRFTHRYWFNEVTNQTVAKDLFQMVRKHNHSDEKLQEVSQRIIDMQEYIENQEVRIQSDTVIRLTIVSIFGLVFTMTIGLLDINLFLVEHSSLHAKLMYFMFMFAIVGVVTFFTVLKSKKVSYVIDALANKK